jgi:hypothetical protein
MWSPLLLCLQTAIDLACNRYGSRAIHRMSSPATDFLLVLLSVGAFVPTRVVSVDMDVDGLCNARTTRRYHSAY